ncbi:MAG: hypothetical protein NT000_00605 [Proteobacteria bacterium]|nr:hypothetical protein [Pseudomonadota bacterium]
MTYSKKIISDQKGNTIIIGLISVTILGIVAAGVGKAFFSMGRQKANVQARTGAIDYENALAAAVGEKILTQLSPSCSTTFFTGLDVPLGNIGSAVSFNNIKNDLQGPLGIAAVPPPGAQMALKVAFDYCSASPQLGIGGGPYLFCLGLRGPPGQSFQGLLGAFAIFRVELSSRVRNSNPRVLASSMTCNQFMATPLDQRELKISYQIHYKKFNDENGVFVSSGFKFYSAP